MEVLQENQDLDFGFGVPAVKNEVTRSPNFGGGVKTEKGEIWPAEGDADADPTMFYAADDFPPLPAFPCMSSSSSTSSTAVPSSAPAGGVSSGATSTSSSSASSAASWAMLKSDYDQGSGHRQEQQQQQLDQDCAYEDDGIGGLDCMSVMEDLDCMGINQLIEDSNEIWDPSPLFEGSPDPPQAQPNPPFDHRIGDQLSPSIDDPFMFLDQGGADKGDHLQAESEDLAALFFDWLKSNRDSISAEELRSIKIKKSTIESAARRLGGGRQGMKQLLKLILQWVQNHRLQNKPPSQATTSGSIQQERLPCYSLPPSQPQPWISPYVTDPTSFTSYIGGGHDPYGVLHPPYHVPPPPPCHQAHMLDASATPWNGQPQFSRGPMHYSTGPDGSALMHSMAPQGYPPYDHGYNPYRIFPVSPGDGLLRTGSSATKEARKKRMARQRRAVTHQHHRTAHNEQKQMIHDSSGPAGAWMYWPPTGPVQPHQQQPASQRQAACDKKQGFKTEKNLKFLLQKVLKQSDVGNLGRIVLPKKEAETHLPELEARDGIPIAMEDISTSRVWNMRYRFWPNNKSRMYLLENTGDFVRSNGLQEGDFIVIYSDVKCGKYMIRGVKVGPHQESSRTEHAKKPPLKALKTQSSTSPSSSSPSPLTHRK